MIQYPLAIALTHRRGAAIGLWRTDNDEEPILIRVLGQTAESLCDTFTTALEFANIKPINLKTLAVGTGPGSFTGLRLGCAFANGFSLGQNIQLLSVKTELSSFFLNENFFQNNEDKEDFIEQLGPTDSSDESSGLVTFYDLFDALNKIKLHPNPVDVLEPNYGREPGPVLKLKGLL